MSRKKMNYISIFNILLIILLIFQIPKAKKRIHEYVIFSQYAAIFPHGPIISNYGFFKELHLFRAELSSDDAIAIILPSNKRVDGVLYDQIAKFSLTPFDVYLVDNLSEIDSRVNNIIISKSSLESINLISSKIKVAIIKNSDFFVLLKFSD